MQLLILSGKGGTGKTTIAASFAYLSKDSIKADCDVDAANLHIILDGKDIEKTEFIGAKMAHIDNEKCIKCKKCENACRFGAISDFKVNELKCEGCGTCVVVCPTGAAIIDDEVTGDTIITDTAYGMLSRAEMDIGAEGSGKLVTEVRKNAAKYYKDGDLIILDGSPGVGCAVMASITGVDLALVVIEPTQSGFSDFVRVKEICDHFDVPTLVCINKYDINNEMTKKIEQYCMENNIEVVGKIPFDTTVKKALNEMKPVVYYDCMAGNEIKNIWRVINEKYCNS